MKTFLAALTLSTALTAPAMVSARPITLTTTLNAYGGPGAYLALYVTDSQGAFAGTLWVAGGKSKYYQHMSEWYRSGGASQIAGVTGASVGAGRTLEITLDLKDALFDAGYSLHIDAAVEDYRDSSKDISVELTSDAAGKPVQGRRYVSTFTYK
ncbi:DUF2271 domain-containing protein [Litoreibacter janthinus]|uniref:Tat (Twin-arginine translocation) pathway signal sequence n=1 Tax=Litoreibacter janthinus TaxID=670154 RepID=A0A1I6GDH1_9RHOB|nr:DUF2271 domain-containing protein [Litoreibacter janthinus]SFR40253.1 Predicted protein [Litoreibacter janthinus]